VEVSRSFFPVEPLLILDRTSFQKNQDSDTYLTMTKLTSLEDINELRQNIQVSEISEYFLLKKKKQKIKKSKNQKIKKKQKYKNFLYDSKKSYDIRPVCLVTL
jgi:hypothetical protein